MTLELPGDAAFWAKALGPLPLTLLWGLIGLVAAALVDLRNRNFAWTAFIIIFTLGSVLVAVVSNVAAYRYLPAFLILQPLSLWLWLTVLRRGPASIPQWGMAVTLLPAVWIASCGVSFVGVVNERIAGLESLPVPVGAVVVSKDAIWENAWDTGGREESISYRVAMTLPMTRAELHRLYAAEGWVTNLDLVGSGKDGGHIARDNDCIRIQIDRWPPGDEWRVAENTLLQMWVTPHACKRLVESGYLPTQTPGR